MFNVGGPEVLVILLVALIVLGPQQLPKAVRSVGNVMAELRRMSSGFQEEVRNALDVTGSNSSGSTASQQAPRLAQHPEEADITETVARNTEPDAALDDEPEADFVTFDDPAAVAPALPADPPSANGSTALSDLPPSGSDHEHDEWVPSDRASG